MINIQNQQSTYTSPVHSNLTILIKLYFQVKKESIQIVLSF